MSDRPAGPYRVLLGGSNPGAPERERLVDNLADLVSLAAAGRITARSRICAADSAEWLPPSAFPALEPHVGPADPWAAWEDMEARDSESSEAREDPEAERDDDPPTHDGPLHLVPSEALEELPLLSLTPVAEPARPPKLVIQSKTRPPAAEVEGPSAGAPVAPPRPRSPAPSREPTPPREAAAGREPVVAPKERSARMAREPERPIREAIPLAGRRPPVGPQPEEPSDPSRPVAEVIAFPSRSHSTYGSAALAADPLPLLLPRGADDETTTGGRTRWMRLVLFAGLLFSALFVLRWYVKTTSSEDFASAADIAVAPPPPAGMTPARAEGPGVDAVYAVMEDELRGRLMPQTRDIAKDGDLEEALLIELTRQRVEVKRVQARVQTWTGRRGDVPQVADFQIWVKSKPGELDRELAAVGLVVGKYINFYSLEVPLFDVTFEGLGPTPRRQSIDPNAARYFYRQRLNIVDFLTGKVPQKAGTGSGAAPLSGP